MAKPQTESATKTRTKWHGLDHLRTFAIFYVFLFHYFIISNGEPGWLPDAAGFGWTGVDLFFVLSGFLISHQLFLQIRLSEAISFRLFFIKRFFRIIPAFLVMVTLYFLFPFFREKEALPPIWKFLTFTQNFDLNLKDYGAFSHAWSLCVEEHFYLFLPLFLIVLQRFKVFGKAYWVLLFFFLGSLAVRMYSYNNLYLPEIKNEDSWMFWYKYIYYPTYNRLDGLLVGVSIAAVYQFMPNVWKKISKFGNLYVLISLLILVCAYLLCKDQQTFMASVFGFPLVAFGYGFLVLGAICPTSFLYKWQSGVTTFLASLSYAIYLSHKGIIHVTHQLLGKFEINPNLMLFISIIACLFGAYLLNLAVEKPFMNLRDKTIKNNKI
jgi:peptidoglycan/LPS O-acetylase OafA/YrhL